MPRLPGQGDDILPATDSTINLEQSRDIDLTMSSDDNTQVYQPPAHIAARIYKRPTGRITRRSSAASSRRNSMTSTHSHHSHHSHHSYHGPQSKQIAQHLRRASILESRKARLADQAAHAEQVRLRAAMAKARTRPSNCEERAVAAQQARERYLAQVRGTCAEEVKRAKRVAEDTREKKQAEGRKLKLEMEEKLAETAKRRAEYRRNLNRGRGLSLPQIEEKKMMRPARTNALDESGAATHIQRAWRKCQRRRIVRNFLALSITTERVRQASFEEMGLLLSQEEVLDCTAKFLKLCGLQDTQETRGGEGERTAVRAFLCAFLVLGHPAHVLSHDGEQEQDLITKARELLVIFENLSARFTTYNQYIIPPSVLGDLSEAYSTFIAAFNAWKAHDSTTLIQTMIAQYVELDLIWQKVKNDSEEAVKAEYRDGIRHNQILLMVRIKRLAGPERAKVMMRDAIRLARRTRIKRSPQLEESQPRGAALNNAAMFGSPSSLTSSGPSLALDDTPAAQVTDPLSSAILKGSQVSSLSPSVHPPASSSSIGSNQASLNLSQDTQGTQDAYDSHDFSSAMSPVPTNRVLVHELALNKTYRVETTKGPSAEVRAALSAQIFAQMRQDLETPANTARWIISLTATCRTRLCRLLAPRSSLHTLISEALDPSVIATQFAAGQFSYDRLFGFMTSILPRLCAPFRDPDVRALTTNISGDTIDRLERLLKVVDLLSLDYANFILHASAPRLVAEAPGYERQRFAEDLAIGAHGLTRTTSWWQSSRAKLVAEADRREVEHVQIARSRPTAEKIYWTGLTDLALAPATILPATLVPETLQLDHARLERMRQDTLRIITISALLLTAKNLLKRDVRQQWKVEAGKLLDLVAHPMAYQSSQLPGNMLKVIEISHVLPGPTRDQLEKSTHRIVRQAAAVAAVAAAAGGAAGELTDPVTRLLANRLRGHVLARLSASSTGERVRVASTASESLASVGLPEFVARIGSMVEELSRVGAVDRDAHGSWYEEIASQATSGRQ